MASYEYTKVNRLKEPHKYMYTIFQGNKFLDAYFKDRSDNIRRFKRDKSQENCNLNDLHLCFLVKKRINGNFKNVDKAYKCISDSLGDEKVDILYFTVDNDIQTNELLSSMVLNQLNHKCEPLIKKWLDRLVQRFEVTKKLYEVYPKGFRKGKGKSNLVQLYWLFSLVLILHYIDTKNIKYLNTLLKVSDLLCSLDDSDISGKIPYEGMLFILSTEVESIKKILNN